MQNNFPEPAMKNGLGGWIGVFDVPESKSAMRILISLAVIEIFTNYCPKTANSG